MPTNVAQSIRQQLLSIAKEQNTDYMYVLIRYAIERTLYRLSVSRYADHFLLKGAMLFSVWSNQPYRPTLDVDFLASGEATLEAMQSIFREVFGESCPQDGLSFLLNTLRVESIKEGQQYEGVHVACACELAGASIPVQIDIAFGDAVTPGPLKVNYPTLLKLPAPSLLAYPKETVVAEKFEAMVKLGIANSRMKDFSDLHFLANNFAFDGELIVSAIKATFRRRNTLIPKSNPIAFTAEFYESSTKVGQWKAFLNKNKLSIDNLELSIVCGKLQNFLMPPGIAAANGLSFNMLWNSSKGWISQS